ncbi:hypothetical protein TWF281_004353 [Arthrobotrys megalospora]
MAPAPPFLRAPRIFWLIKPGDGHILPDIDTKGGWTNFWSARPVTQVLHRTHPFYRVAGYYPETFSGHFAVSLTEVPARELWCQCVKRCLDSHADKINVGGPLAEEIMEELCAPQQFEHLAVIFGTDRIMAIEKGGAFSAAGEFRARSFLRLIGAMIEQYGPGTTAACLQQMVYGAVTLLVEERLQEQPQHRVRCLRGGGSKPVDWSKLGDIEEGEPVTYEATLPFNAPTPDPDNEDNVPPVAWIAAAVLKMMAQADSSSSDNNPADKMDIDGGNAAPAPATSELEAGQPEASQSAVDNQEAPKSPIPLEPVATFMALAGEEGQYLGGPAIDDTPVPLPGFYRQSSLQPYDHSVYWPENIRYFTPSCGTRPMRSPSPGGPPPARCRPVDTKSETSGTPSDRTIVAPNQPPGPAGYVGTGGFVFPVRQSR